MSLADLEKALDNCLTTGMQWRDVPRAMMLVRWIQLAARSQKLPLGYSDRDTFHADTKEFINSTRDPQVVAYFSKIGLK